MPDPSPQPTSRAPRAAPDPSSPGEEAGGASDTLDPDEQSVRERLQQYLRSTWTTAGRRFALLLAVQWPLSILVAALASPEAWAGAEAAPGGYVWTALLVGGLITGPSAVGAWVYPQARVSRHGVAARVDVASMTAADAIEVYNSRLLTGRSNRRAARFARRSGIAQTAGSDAHIAEMVGQAVTVVDAPAEDAESILTAIATGATRVEGSRTPWRISLRQFGGGVRRRIGHVLSEW